MGTGFQPSEPKINKSTVQGRGTKMEYKRPATRWQKSLVLLCEADSYISVRGWRICCNTQNGIEVIPTRCPMKPARFLCISFIFKSRILFNPDKNIISIKNGTQLTLALRIVLNRGAFVSSRHTPYMPQLHHWQVVADERHMYLILFETGKHAHTYVLHL